MVRVSSAKTRVGHGSATSQLHFQAPLIEERVEGGERGRRRESTNAPPVVFLSKFNSLSLREALFLTVLLALDLWQC